MRYLPFALTLSVAAFAADLSDQAKRGKEVFSLKSASGVACSTCHQLEGQGKAIGPDLKQIGQLHPRAIVTAILATRTQYVQEITLHTGRPFPAIKSGEVYFDLSKTPPAELTTAASAFKGVKDNGSWKHPAESRGLTKDQLADVIAYIRFATSGDTKGVDPKDLP